VAQTETDGLEVLETREWVDSLDYVLSKGGPNRAGRLLQQLALHARREAGINLPLPKPVVNRIVVVGDTGCRISIGNVFQACGDPTQWPFPVIASAAAAMVSACGRSASAASVGERPLAERVNSGAPSSASSVSMCRPTVGWLSPSVRAAPERLPSASTASSVR